ncbi:hypothetical protein CISIN_1g035090mg [Citrus sinensis]|uniref:Uncharacterized protein n=1 Tax=Citrus sinensis TaxID=2711 RepID=A0A067H6F0_CITSI|nr:hypothetical protein CISIN_1g035090mg [Citrus sinensis]
MSFNMFTYVFIEVLSSRWDVLGTSCRLIVSETTLIFKLWNRGRCRFSLQALKHGPNSRVLFVIRYFSRAKLKF